ncbi:MAG: ester cyclase [Pseudonocardiales bacterium]
MSRERNIAVLENAVQLINSGEIDAGVNMLFAEDAIDHDPAPGQGAGRAGFRVFFRSLTRAFPDMHLEPAHLVADDEHLSLAFTVSGTHRGDLNGIAPTGRGFTVRGVEIFRFREGKVVERWGLTDELGIMTQLELVPS